MPVIRRGKWSIADRETIPYVLLMARTSGQHKKHGATSYAWVIDQWKELGFGPVWVYYAQLTSEEHEELRDWVETVCGGQVGVLTHESTPKMFMVAFELETDAALFRLTWISGQ